MLPECPPFRQQASASPNLCCGKQSHSHGIGDPAREVTGGRYGQLRTTSPGRRERGLAAAG